MHEITKQRKEGYHRFLHWGKLKSVLKFLNLFLDQCRGSHRTTIATFRLQYEDDYEYEFSVLSTRFWFGGRKFSKCACSELKTRARSRPRTPIWRSLIRSLWKNDGNIRENETCDKLCLCHLHYFAIQRGGKSEVSLLWHLRFLSRTKNKWFTTGKSGIALVVWPRLRHKNTLDCVCHVDSAIIFLHSTNHVNQLCRFSHSIIRKT